MSDYNLPLGLEPHFSRYISFIRSRPVRGKKRTEGFELHHILPRSMRGSNKSENLILLTPREHYLAHLILWKCYGAQMAYAFWMMANQKITVTKITARQYEQIRLEVAKARHSFIYSAEAKEKMSKAAKLRKEKGLGVVHSENTKQKMSVAAKGKPSWHKGRTKSEETKARMSAGQKGHLVSEETRKKYSESHKGKVRTAEAKQKTSESLRARYQSISKEERTQRMKKAWETRRSKKNAEGSLPGEASNPD